MISTEMGKYQMSLKCSKDVKEGYMQKHMNMGNQERTDSLRYIRGR